MMERAGGREEEKKGIKDEVNEEEGSGGKGEEKRS